MDALVIGAGQLGPHVAATLEATGHRVRIANRSASGPHMHGIDRVRLDATDQVALTRELRGVDAVFLCIHASAYRPDVWERELPMLERGVLSAAQESGVTVVFPESLYAFDPASIINETSPYRPQTPLGRVRVQLLEQRTASSAQTISVAASDFHGPGAGAATSHAARIAAAVAHGAVVRPLGSADEIHAWTFLPDLAAAMVAAAELAPEPDRLLLAPVTHATQRELVESYAQAAGRSAPPIRPIPSWLLRAAGAFHAPTRAVASTLPMFEHSLRVDSTASETLLGIKARPLAEAAGTTVAAA